MSEVSFESKKLAPLRILEVLEKYSDENHILTQAEIAEKLDREYGIVLERKAVARNLKLLEDAGFEFGTGKDGRGVYLLSRHFEEGELRMLIDSVAFSRHIPEKYVNDLVEKLRSLGSVYFGRSFRAVQRADMLYRSQSKDIFYIIEKLGDAIANKVQVSFMYNEYGTDKKLHPAWSAPQNVNPYRLVAVNNYYYLLANIDQYDNLVSLRLDKVTQFALTSFPRKNIRNTSAGPVCIGTYLSAHPYMLTGEPVHVVAELARDRVGLAIDAFGENFTLTDSGKETVAVSVSVNEEDAYLWAMQNGDVVEILEPQSLRDRLRLAVGKMRRKYLKTDADAYGEAVESARQNGNLSLVGVPARGKLAREGFGRLWRLELVDTDVKDLSFAAARKELKVFIAANCPAADFSALAQLPLLKKAEIRSTNLSDLGFLRGKKLEQLILAENPVADYAPLYEMTGLSYLTTGSFTVQKLDLERLRAIYPGIRISVDEELECCDSDSLTGKEELDYPYNFVRAVFGWENFSADTEGLTAFLQEHIPYRLSEEEAQVFFGKFRDGKTLAQIAVQRGVPAVFVSADFARLLRKLRHPGSSRLIRKYIQQEDGQEE